MPRIRRWLARAPIPLLRAGLGPLLPAFVLVEHLGRRTGRRRYVVLEVVLREPGAVVVAAGYGPTSQWYRNLAADPRVRLWWRRAVGVRGRAELLGAAEGARVLERYRRLHPWRARLLARALGIADLDRPGTLEQIAGRVPLVRLRSPRL
ncbi:nitroreductase family deazaflavin-dependent oxidoreductase [Georgenia thermotolerans]|uniref:nitroreductase family deazaflavin-dependent oxidoreductase n=1 Tax=Georgenia thermotolerans TaxID=527326 RepID=UPI001D026E51|nr:nitroreductase family deazaflavin-dependent oxidoreductase [Georgenia thermotolerans]